jgi:hypothetical protein
MFKALLSKIQRVNKHSWAIGIIGSFVGFFISQGLTYYTFNTNLTMAQKTLKLSQIIYENTKKIEMIRLIHELSNRFYGKESDQVYRNIRTSIESCEKLYKSWGGKFSHDEINIYLGFFEDLGFYNAKGLLDVDVINHMFGAYIIEAYEYNEIRRYIEEFQRNTKQKSAFSNFGILAKKLEEIPERKDEVEIARRGCYK